MLFRWSFQDQPQSATFEHVIHSLIEQKLGLLIERLANNSRLAAL